MANRLWNLVGRGNAPESAEWPQVDVGGPVAGDDDIRHVIASCCEAHADALILSFDDEAVCKVRLLEMGDESFRVSLETDLPPLLRPPTQCSVSLRFGQRNRVFIATVLKIRPGEMSGGALELLLRIPGEIAAGDPRMAFRVPILKPSDLVLTLRVNGTVIDDARPLNLSLIGMLIESWDHDPLKMSDAKIDVILQRGENRVELGAEIRRCYERRIAVFFPDVLTDGNLVPPDELRAIVRELEALWLRSRAR